MLKEVSTEAPTVEEAIDAALDELGVQQDAVGFEVLEEPGRKMLGFGAEKPARVRVWIKDEYLHELEETRQAAGEDLDADEEPEFVAAPSAFGGRDVEELPELTDEELDNVADQAVGVIKPILEAFGITATIDEYEGDEGGIILDIVGGDGASLIGRHGRTLDALQALVSAITNRRLGFRYPVIVDVEGYRQRRREKLEEIARRGADRAARQGVTVKLRPMTAYERRLVHMALRADRRVATHSEGEEPFRQVVILPK
jgi:spoIIIJ-associated protein